MSKNTLKEEFEKAVNIVNNYQQPLPADFLLTPLTREMMNTTERKNTD